MGSLRDRLGGWPERMLAMALVVAASSAAIAACADEPADALEQRGRGGSRGSGTNPGDPDDPNDPNQLTPEEAKYRAVEPDLVRECGKTCHDTGTYSQPAPTFLAPPDTYKSIKAQRGIVVRDVFTSILITKGPHAGPALSQNPELEKKVVEWLEAEAILIQAQKLPSTPPFTVVPGPNEVDLTPAATGGLTGVKLKFDAAMVGTMLSLSKLTIVAPVGPDVHILQPRFVRVLPQPREDGTVEVPDPADSFSNSDQTIANGTEAPLSPGSVLFSGDGWRPFDMAADKLRIEVTQLEPGKISVISAAATCKNVEGFAQNVLPAIRNQQTSQGNTCQGCHGQGLGGLNLSSQDNALICQQVLQKLNQANLAQSLIITKVTGGMAHSGGTVPDANAWRNLFQNNVAVFF